MFSDVVMPGMNGIDLAQEVRRRYPELPVVLTSGYSHVLAEKGTMGSRCCRSRTRSSSFQGFYKRRAEP